MSSVIEKINQIIKRDGCIEFPDFLGITQYGSLGYYQNRNPFGDSGDFITANHFGPILSWALFYEAHVRMDLTKCCVLEIGAGNGDLCISFLKAAAMNQVVPKQYYIQEISPTLQKIQKKRIQDAVPKLASCVNWLNEDEYPKNFKGLVVANELLDCLPFFLVKKQSNHWFQRVIQRKNGELNWGLTPANCAILNYLERYVSSELLDGYETEVCLSYKKWLGRLTSCLEEAVCVFVDYGYEATEYFHPQRFEGTLTCFHRHQKHSNPFIHLGQQDITAHVQFDAFSDEAFNQNYELISYNTQAAWILSGPIFQQFSSVLEKENTHEMLKNNLQALTDPSMMGEVFKCLILKYNRKL